MVNSLGVHVAPPERAAVKGTYAASDAVKGAFTAIDGARLL